MSVFVTGATGMIGSAVLARLLRDSNDEIVALVRGPSKESATARLNAVLTSFDPELEGSELLAKIRVALGDAERSHFALGDGDYTALRQRCTRVIHAAGAVRMNLPIDKARSSAIGSVRAIFEFARHPAAAPLEKIDIVSTVGVGGRDIALLREEWVGAKHAFHNTYEQAKAEAENEIGIALAQGLPITVHRPSMVVGDSRTGRTSQFQVFYHLVEFLSGRRTHGVFPALGRARLDLVPVDHVAEAIVRASGNANTRGRVMHLCSGPDQAIGLIDLQHHIRRAAAAAGESLPRPRYLSRRVFGWIVSGLRQVVDSKTRSALATLPVFLDYLETDQGFDNAQTRRWLEEQRVDVPRTDHYLPRVLDYYFAAKAGR